MRFSCSSRRHFSKRSQDSTFKTKSFRTAAGAAAIKVKAMEWRGGHPDNFVPSDFGYNGDAYPNSYSYPTNNIYDTEHPGYYVQNINYQNDHYSSSQNENYYEHYLNGSHQNSHSSYHIQDSSGFFQAPGMLPAQAPRVHINPNYRPKAGNDPESDALAARPTKVHINPHWKGRVDPVTKTDNNLTKSGSQDGHSRNTIFVNPKVLSRMKIESMAQGKEVCPNILESCHSSDVTPQNQVDVSSLHKVGSFNPRSTRVHNVLGTTDESKDMEKHSTEPVCVPKPAFLVLSSTKLVRNSGSDLCHKSIAVPVGFQKTQPHLSSVQSKTNKTFLKSPGTPTIKVAKQVCSKYRLVRNATSNVRGKGTPIMPTKRLRRKSNSKVSSASVPNSIYKYVRKPAVSESLLCSSMKILSNTTALTSPNNITLAAKSNLRRNVKSRYKLVKNHSAQQQKYEEGNGSRGIQSRFKLVRRNASESLNSPRKRNSVNKSTFSEFNLPLYPSCIKSRFKIRRNAVESKMVQGKKVSRFRVIKTPNFTKLKTLPLSMWKLRKCHESLSLANPGLQKPGFYGNLIWMKGRNMQSSSQIGHHTPSLQSYYIKSNCTKSKSRTIATRNSSNKSLLNIGGALYRSTRTTLTRAHPGKSKEQVISFRGKRFVLDGQGTTLRPASSLGNPAHKSEYEKGPSIGRVDIGGVTFTRRSDNTLVRTNTHFARNVLSIAKMRSIALLTEKLRKNNQPCLIYHRFGRCRAHEEAKCWRVHDPKNISVCRKFLQGSCDKEKCLLSHDVGPEKMPTCRFFLEGCCVRDNCPYLHVKLSARAAICRQFLHGYCEAGDMCKKRHVNLCPDFDQDGKCSRGKYCPYPHGKHTKKGTVRKRSTNINDRPPVSKKGAEVEEKVEAAAPGEEVEKRKRYYDESTSVKDHVAESSTDLNGSEFLESKRVLESDEDTEEHNDSHIVQRRPKLGILPAFIPLE